MRRVPLCMVLALWITGCVQPPRPTKVPVQTIAVFPPNNRTGDRLLIAGASFLEKYVLATEPYTVADALGAEARAQLAKAGFDVAAAPVTGEATNAQIPSSTDEAAAIAARRHMEGAVLYIEIRRWESSGGTEPTAVIAWIVATLIDAPNGQVLWTAEHPPRPVQTPGVISLGEAYAVAAHTLMAEMLAPLRPGRSASRTNG
ncbi:MAG TPA: hypothetical protein VMW56_27450 [Candidatus Margulisiibacteriota bacterium]|nr:hypothetical protein [Candidatus Margulisiibacteriota bacterium]